MKNRRSNWQIAVSGILIFVVWLGALPVYAQTRQDGKGVGVKVVSELPSKEKRWALIVGIDEYLNDVSTLKGSVNDAKALKNVLVNNAGFPENQIVLLTTDSFEQDKRPTRENILGALSDLYSRVPEDGLLLFSFSGHGISVGSQAFLIPSNGRFTKNPELLQDFSIDVSRIKRAVETMKVKQVLMLLDACRNEPGKGDVPNRLTDAYKNGFSFDVANSDVKAFATLYATSIGERAYEFLDKDTNQFRGYFSHAVEEALKGKAANDKGEVTLSRLIDYLETTVPKKVKWDKGETQIPTANYSETYRANQLILAVANNSYLANEVKNNSDLNESSAKSSKNLKLLSWINFKPTAQNLTKYDSISIFIEGLAQVYKSGKYGFINQKGEEAVPTDYALVGNYSEGFAEINTELGTGGKHGFVDKSGRIVIDLKYDDVQEFSEGLAPAFVFPKGWGFIDKEGRMILTAKYESASPFGNGLALVKQGKYGFINKNGVIAIPFKYYYAESFSEGLAYVGNGKQIGFINKTGKIVIPMKYSQASSFSEGLANVCEGERSLNNLRCGFIDRTGKVIIPLKYDFAFPFENGLASVNVDNKYGFVDAKGKEIIPIKYENTSGTENELITVKLNTKWGAVNKNGAEIIRAKYEYIWCRAFIDYGFLGVILNGKKGFVDHYGNEYFDF